MSISRMPALFLGHGNPMNVLEDNPYSRSWQQLGLTLPRPRAILAISAHWYTRGTRVTAMKSPRTIHDFGGFPQALFDVEYPAPGSPTLAAEIIQLLAPVAAVAADESEWGFDHGSWGVVKKMYPAADIPMVQLSIDATADTQTHYQLGRKLSALRDQGVMIIASGNVVHNLRMARWQESAAPYPWAQSFNQFVRDNINWRGEGRHPLVDYQRHEGAGLSIPTPEHYLPLLYILGCRHEEETVAITIDGIEMASLSMLSVQVG